eukprot:3856236-Alexandrium_andersonii.AAC.1
MPGRILRPALHRHVPGTRHLAHALRPTHPAPAAHRIAARSPAAPALPAPTLALGMVYVPE